MKALVCSPGDGVRLSEVPTPESDPGEVAVTPRRVGVCGTDLELIDATIDPAYVSYPLILGHEWVGTLEEDIDGVAQRGDTVVVEGIVPCGVCAACLAGDTNRCGVYDEIGFTRPGAAAERIVVPRELVHRIDESVALDDAVLVEPMAVVWRALTRFPVRAGSRVAIIGDGTIALLAAHLVRLFDPAAITVIGRRSEQSELAARAGADRFVTETPDERFDLVIEAAGVVAATATAIEVAERGATIALLGLPPHGSTIEVHPDDLVNNDLVIHGSFSYTRTAWREVVQRINQGDLQPSFLITHRFGLDDFSEAVEVLRGVPPVTGPRGKVVLSLD